MLNDIPWRNFWKTVGAYVYENFICFIPAEVKLIVITKAFSYKVYGSDPFQQTFLSNCRNHVQKRFNYIPCRVFTPVLITFAASLLSFLLFCRLSFINTDKSLLRHRRQIHIKTVLPHSHASTDTD